MWYKTSLYGTYAHCTFEDDWRPDVENLSQDVEDAKHFLDFSPYSTPGRHYGIDPSEFEYCAPGVF